MERSSQRSKRESEAGIKFVDVWSAQCGECFKWRIIPTLDEYEEIRSKFIEEPFICSKKAGSSCDDPADIECDNSRIWIIDKPNLPKTPTGFKRRLVMRKDLTRMDCYYDSPDGKVLRSSTIVERFLCQKPEYGKGLSMSDFSFTTPKVMEGTIPPNFSKK